MPSGPIRSRVSGALQEVQRELRRITAELRGDLDSLVERLNRNK